MLSFLFRVRLIVDELPVFLCKEKVGGNVVQEVLVQLLPILDGRWLEVKFLDLALADCSLTDTYARNGKKLHLFEQLVEHGTPISLVKDVQR